MSSPLDQRMRAMAREEAQALLGVPFGAPTATEPTAEDLRQQITELRERLDNLESDVRDMATTRARRTPRKTTEPAESSE